MSSFEESNPDEYAYLRREVKRETELVREAYFDDSTVSDQEYGQMIEDADRADQYREYTKEKG